MILNDMRCAVSKFMKKYNFWNHYQCFKQLTELSELLPDLISFYQSLEMNAYTEMIQNKIKHVRDNVIQNTINNLEKMILLVRLN